MTRPSSSPTSSPASSTVASAGASSIDSLLRAVAEAPAVAPAQATTGALKDALAGRFSIERTLGEGGMGVVYLAREVELDRDVALKVVRPQFARDPKFRERLWAEAKTAARLSHPNVVPVHRVDDVDGVLVLAMGYVDGSSLRAHLVEHGRLPLLRALSVLRDVARALAHAHAAGIVHRDIKPDNILVEKKTGRVVVADFGIAAARGVEGAAGTKAYMSPEQETGGKVFATSDIYSLGVTAFELVTGTRPLLPLVEPLTGVPAAVSELVERMLSPDPSRRPQSAADVVDALTMALEGPPIPRDLRMWALGDRTIDIGFFAILVPLSIVALVAPRFLYLPFLALAYSALRHGQRLQRLFRSGHEVADLNAALTARADEIRFENDHLPDAGFVRITKRIASTGGWVAGLAFVVVLALSIAGATPVVGVVAVAVLLLAVVVAIGALVALGVASATPSTPWRERTMLALRRRFWGSPTGAWVARVLTPGKKQEPPIEARLASAATLLVERRREPGVADVVAALEKRAADARRAGDRDALVDAVKRLERIKLALEGDDAALVTTLTADARAMTSTMPPTRARESR